MVVVLLLVASAGALSSSGDLLGSAPAARLLASRPSPELGVSEVARAVVRGLQSANVPKPNAGLERCFYFMSFKCRKAVTARQGASSLDRFLEYAALSPQLVPFLGCDEVRWLDAPTIIESTNFRGALATLGVEVRRRRGFRHASGFERRGLDVSEFDWQNDPDFDVRRYALRFEQQRRPPLQHCWLLDEIIDVRYIFAGDLGNDAVAN